METMTEEVIVLFQSGQFDQAFLLLQERDRVKQQVEAIEGCLEKKSITAFISSEQREITRRARPIAEAIRVSIERQIETEEEITRFLESLLENAHESMKDLKDGQKLFTTYVEGWVEGSGVDITVR